MPEENCHPDKITPWEVAAIRQIEGQNNVQYVIYNPPPQLPILFEPVSRF